MTPLVEFHLSANNEVVCNECFSVMGHFDPWPREACEMHRQSHYLAEIADVLRTVYPGPKQY